MTYRDPLASLAPVPIIVTLGDGEFVIPALAAIDWLRILLREDFSLLEVVPGLLEQGAGDEVEEMLALGEISWKDVSEACYDAITVASGRDWWTAVRFLAVVRVSWNVVGGMMARLNIDASKVSLSYWLDAAYHLAQETIAMGKDGQQNLVRFTSEMEAPPPGMEVELDEEFEALAFERAVRMSQR